MDDFDEDDPEFCVPYAEATGPSWVELNARGYFDCITPAIRARALRTMKLPTEQRDLFGEPHAAL